MPQRRYTKHVKLQKIKGYQTLNCSHLKSKRLWYYKVILREKSKTTLQVLLATGKHIQQVDRAASATGNPHRTIAPTPVSRSSRPPSP